MNSPIPQPSQDLGALAMFAVVAEERSFTKAAVRLGVSRSAVSHAMQALEERLEVRLLARTTRAVAVTEAGERLLTKLGPALESIDAALLEVGRTPRSSGRPHQAHRAAHRPLDATESEARGIHARVPRHRARHHERGRHPWRPGCASLRCGDPPRRVPSPRHDRRAGHARATRRRRGRAWLLRRASEAEDTARHHGTPLRAVSHGRRRPHLPLGVREARQAGVGLGNRGR